MGSSGALRAGLRQEPGKKAELVRVGVGVRVRVRVGPRPWHTEVPGLGIQPAPQQQAEPLQ